MTSVGCVVERPFEWFVVVVDGLGFGLPGDKR